MKLRNLLSSNTWLSLSLFAGLFLLTSCSEEVEPTTITIDDAAELVAYSLANRTYGAVSDLTYVADEILTLIDCNESESNDRSASESSFDGEISVTYDYSENYARTCDGSEVLNYSFVATQNLTSIRFDFDQTINGIWSIDGVEEGSTILTYNGPYTRSGLWTFNLRDDHTDNVVYTSSLLDLTYDLDLDRITGGESTFTLEGTSTVYEDYTYGGEVVFQGSDLAIITFDTGEQYELDLESGDITEI